MYNNCVSIFETALYIIVNIVKKYILITTTINYLIRTKVRNYIKNTSFNKVFPKVLAFRTSGFFPNSKNSKYKTFLIKLPNLLFLVI